MKSPYPLIDIHTHNPVQPETVVALLNLPAPELLKKNTENVFFSWGVHPWNSAKADMEKEMKALRELSLKIVMHGLGEVGIDKSRKIPLERQIEVFRMQLEFAENAHLPVIIHCVRAFQEIIEIRKKMNPKRPWVIHGYSGSKTAAVQLVRAGCSISFGRQILFEENEKIRAAAAVVPFDRIFLETDEWNGNIEELYEELAKIRGISVASLAEQLRKNFFNLY
ncbi:MAG: TatD family hydrolase [Bacteroidota bacterium]